MHSGKRNRGPPRERREEKRINVAIERIRGLIDPPGYGYLSPSEFRFGYHDLGLINGALGRELMELVYMSCVGKTNPCAFEKCICRYLTGGAGRVEAFGQRMSVRRSSSIDFGRRRSRAEISGFVDRVGARAGIVEPSRLKRTAEDGCRMGGPEEEFQELANRRNRCLPSPNGGFWKDHVTNGKNAYCELKRKMDRGGEQQSHSDDPATYGRHCGPDCGGHMFTCNGERARDQEP